jgi:hypothetical protein
MKEVWSKIEDEVFIMFRYEEVDRTLSTLSNRVTYSIEEKLAKYYLKKQNKKVK